MKLILLEYFLLAIVFLTLLIISYKQKRAKGMIVVKNLRHLCKSELEVKIYDELQKRGFYVSPSLQCGYCVIPIALEPYKIAIFTYPKKKTTFIKQPSLKIREWYLRSGGWKVLKFSQESLQKDLKIVSEKVLSQVKIVKA